uniref:Uncharacterized protein n=1 Tax=Oncorhynchus tshawytscha TaxID=74940 RepID=A0A8C8K5N6_ONCTS
MEPFCVRSSCGAMIKRDGRGHSYCAARGEILGPAQDGRKRKHLPRMFSLITVPLHTVLSSIFCFFPND